MKNFKTLLLLSLFCIILFSCKKQALTTNYEGTLRLNYTNTYPKWSVTESMNVKINKDALITIESGIVTYSGETLISEDSKIERSGQWNMSPKGQFEDGSKENIEIDAVVSVLNDITKIYAKDDSGNWILVQETENTESPDSDLSFNIDDAQINESVCGITVQTGSIVWTLTLIPALTD